MSVPIAQRTDPIRPSLCRNPLSRKMKIRLALAAGLALIGLTSPLYARTNVYSEDFEFLTLNPPVDENFLAPQFPEAFTHIPPPNWQIDNNLPGIGDALIGVEEWEGWSFADKDFWIAAAAGTPGGGPAGGREFFDLGQGTIAVADPDQWNDLGNPANDLGFYNTLLSTPFIDFAPIPANEDRLILSFETSWITNGCCDQGSNHTPPDPNGNNMTAFVNLQLPSGGTVRILEWESAPYLAQDQMGFFTIPTNDPFGSVPNPDYQPSIFNERIFIDLSFLLNNPPNTLGEEGEISLDAMGGVGIEFGMEDAGDDGAWGIDNVELTSFDTMLGDMDISGVLDSADIDAFALGMLDEFEYLFSYFGELPVTRGSLDSVFDFDDISWFVGIMEGAGVASAAESLAEAMAPEPTPEPSTALLTSLAASLFMHFRLRR